MLMALHKNARTTPAVRAEIAASTETASVLAQRFGITDTDGVQVKEALRLWGSLARCPSSADLAALCGFVQPPVAPVSAQEQNADAGDESLVSDASASVSQAAI